MNYTSSNPRSVVYSFVVADLLHYGHLQLLQTAKGLGDYHICGVLTDDAAASYRARPITNFDERVAIISNMRCVDRVMLQDARDPTANLKKIHLEFPDAQLVLVHGNDWQDIPGRAYVESIGGRVVQPEYYRRLSDSRVRQQLAQAGTPVHYESFTEHFRIDSIHVFEKDDRQFVLSTKANTLRALQPLVRKSRIEPIVTFRVSDWTEGRDDVLALVRKSFGPGPVVVRSSAINEDTYNRSQAGCYTSRVNVPTRGKGLGAAIDEVVRSYTEKGNPNPLNQVLVQPHTADVKASGVVFTREPRSGGPYYVINYDDRTGSTESVTGGTENRALDVAHACLPARWPRRWRPLAGAVREIEHIIPGTPLDIEFGIDRRGRVTIFQVRPLASPQSAAVDSKPVAALLDAEAERFWKATRRVRHLDGATTCFSDMAFWNPAEIIGDRPNPLAYSLYRRVLMDRAWHEALAPLGYAKVAPAPLMAAFAGKPYVDLRCTCNALLPSVLRRRLRDKLVAHYLRLLAERPELHDKVEFDIIDNCLYFSLDRRLSLMKKRGFSERELREYRVGLVGITRRALERADRISSDVAASTTALEASRARAAAEVREARDQPAALLRAASGLLEACEVHGTMPFTLMARLAFIGKRLLRSMVERGWLTDAEYDRFMDGVRTVATEMCEDDDAVAAGRMTRAEFLKQYGHLRPGTYDITSLRYADEPAYFGLERSTVTADAAAWSFKLRRDSAAAIRQALAREGLPAKPEDLLRFIREAIEARERVKFEFTKNLSEAIELIARAGQLAGFTRDDLSQLDVAALERATRLETREIRDDWTRVVNAARVQRRIEEAVSLPPLLFSPDDFFIVERPVARPNFITRHALSGDLVSLNGSGAASTSLQGKIVLIEQADPGYDWLFTQRIAGLITRYGGVASHMAIRCAEFGLPAAIGCGDVIFRRLQNARGVLLDCRQRQVRPIA